MPLRLILSDMSQGAKVKNVFAKQPCDSQRNVSHRFCTPSHCTHCTSCRTTAAHAAIYQIHETPLEKEAMPCCHAPQEASSIFVELRHIHALVHTGATFRVTGLYLCICHELAYPAKDVANACSCIINWYAILYMCCVCGAAAT